MKEFFNTKTKNTKVKSGDYVTINNLGEPYNKIPFQVTVTSGDYVYYSYPNSCIQFTGSSKNYTKIDISDYTDIVAEFEATIKAEREKNVNEILKPNLKNRNIYEHKNLSDAIDFNFFVNKDWDNYQNIETAVTCCAQAKASSEIDIYIPKIYLKYCGYTQKEFKEWLDFLVKCDIELEYSIQECDFEEHFDHYITNIEEQYNIQFQINQNVSGIYCLYPTKNEDYIKLHVNSSKNDLHGYLKFICIRYAYNRYYWSIPKLAMEIKNSLGEEVTHFQALLMAHINHEYNFYYCLVGHDEEQEDENDEHCNAEGVVNPFQDFNEVLKNFRCNMLMNTSWEYLGSKYKHKYFKSYFENQDWKGLLKELKTITNYE